ncbi:MAG: hypothetical protein GC168_09585 [Candidatus Hydrogenedens sp.]|nr:hypothetical protein [Candidatus Hydrogenedens sp.]
MNTIQRTDTLGDPKHLAAISEAPRIWVSDQFVSAEEVSALLDMVPAEDSPEATALRAHRDDTGLSFEWPIDGVPLLEDLRVRLTEILGVENALPETFRFRRYFPGNGHPEHLDCYEIGSHSLVFTALMHLEDAESGGETLFPSTAEGALAVGPRAGRLVVWANHLPDGRRDPASSHAGGALHAGSKTTLTWFVYAPLEAAAHTPGSGSFEPPAHAPGKRLYFIDDGVPSETTEVMADACRSRGIRFLPVDAQDFDFSQPSPLLPGDMMYRAAVSGAAIKTEQFLFADGVATLYSDDEGVFFDTGAALTLFERAGVPTPRTVYCNTTNRARLRRYAEFVGGFPLLAKFPGASGGVNVVLIESIQGLNSFVDHTLYNGFVPLLSTYIPDAEHWRVVVVGGGVAGAYINQTRTDDFRSYDDGNPENYRLPDDDEMLRSAIAAVQSLGVEFGGVDILRHGSGRHYVLEANFPCYFADAQRTGGFDIAGAIVEHLHAKAIRLAELF